MELKFDANTLNELNKRIHELEKVPDTFDWTNGEDDKYFKALYDVKQVIKSMIYEN